MFHANSRPHLESRIGPFSDDLFASTPPLFLAKLLVSLAATLRPSSVFWTLMALDVSCAFLYAKVVRELYIELPDDSATCSTSLETNDLLELKYFSFLLLF